MRQIKTTTGGDLEVVNGLLQVVDGRECLAQTLKQRLQTSRGEWRYDLSHGIPYIQRVAGKANDDLIRAIYREALSETPGVRKVTSIRLTRDSANRTLTVRAEVIGEDGVNVLSSPVKIDTGGDVSGDV